MIEVGSRVVVRTDTAVYRPCWVCRLKPLTVFFMGHGRKVLTKWITETVRGETQWIRELTPSACPVEIPGLGGETRC